MSDQKVSVLYKEENYIRHFISIWSHSTSFPFMENSLELFSFCLVISCLVEFSWISSTSFCFHLIFLREKKSQFARSGEYGSCRAWEILCLVKNCYSSHSHCWNLHGVVFSWTALNNGSGRQYNLLCMRDNRCIATPLYVV